ncbi:MAG: secretion system protein E [Deltaproteobacteria bacterium]|jgi:type IV pilus assembly protein PilB|nr:secretion system protein E [Deltaproteobacteria bacterium]
MARSAAQSRNVADLLVEQGRIEAEQLAYAKRVQSKLRPPRPLLQVLKELGYTNDSEVRELLSSQPIDLRLGDLLIELGLIDESTLDEALEIQGGDTDHKSPLGSILLERGWIAESRLYEALAFQLGLPYEEPHVVDLDSELLAEVPPAWCREHAILPLRKEGEATWIAFANPVDPAAREAVGQLLGADKVLRAVIAPTALKRIWSQLEGDDTASAGPDPQGADIVRLVEELIIGAIQSDASDIHIEPTSQQLRVRYREDGVLVRVRELPLAVANPLTSRIKVLARADISERRRHQDGRFQFRCGGRDLDLRASFYVTVNGEKTVLRLLNRDRPLLPLEELGMPPAILERFVEDGLERPSGVILVTGPTGSGKTSTLYSCVNHIRNDEVSIITAEDPVEYMIDGIAQCSLDSEIDRSYEETLRHIVRQDPDVIVIGEIRDTFSAETAIQAALTGHKVITTFHTEDTIGGLLRLLNMNIEAFLISSTVVSVLAQRLLRKVCVECAVPYQPTPVDLRRLGYSGRDLDDAEFRVGRGCETCRFTGYKGRVAIFELLTLGEEIRDAILRHETAHEIRRTSRDEGDLVSLLEDGIVKAARGLTTLDEILRVLPRLDRPRPLAELHRTVGE